MELGGKGVGNIVYGGNYNSNQGTIDTFGTVTNNPNLDLTYFVSALDDLRKKSAYWASLPPNGNSASYQWGWQFSKGNNECVQVMNVEASKLGGGNWVNFHSSLSGKTIVINVVDTGAVTINRVQDMVDPSGNRGYAFSPAVTKNILWNFPHATSVTLNGGAEFQGSILVPNGDLIFKHPGHSGRVIVAGDLTQNYGGSEFHNYQVNISCVLLISLSVLFIIPLTTLDHSLTQFALFHCQSATIQPRLQLKHQQPWLQLRVRPKHQLRHQVEVKVTLTSKLG